MAYNLEALKSKLAAFNGENKKGGEKSKLQFWKPEVGEVDVRFLPYKDSNEQPFQEVTYYDNKQLSERRMVVPSQFGCEDPVQELITELKKDRSKEAWKMVKALSAKTRYYAPVLVRGQEEKGVQIWEFSQTICKDIYSILVHQDYREENLMDPHNGYDFTVAATVVPGKTFNGYPVKEIKLTPRRKATKIAKTQAEIDKIVKAIPNLEEHFKGQVRPYEEVKTALEGFLAVDASAEASETGTDHNAAAGTASTDAAVDDINKQFEDL